MGKTSKGNRSPRKSRKDPGRIRGKTKEQASRSGKKAGFLDRSSRKNTKTRRTSQGHPMCQRRAEKGRAELEEMMERLRESKDLEAEERQRLEDEIRTKHEEVTVIQTQVQTKEQENMLLQQEMSEARKKPEEATQALIEAT